MFNLLATRTPSSYADSNLTVDLAIDSDPSLENVETKSHRRPSRLARGYTTASHFSRFTAPVQNLAAKTGVVAGMTAALSPMAMAADPTVLGFDMVDLFVMGGACLAAGIALKNKVVSAVNWAEGMAEGMAEDIGRMAEEFEDRRTPRSPMAPRVGSAPSAFEMAKQTAALSRILPPLGDMELPPGVKLVEVPGATYMMSGKCETTVSSVYWMTTAGSNDLAKHLTGFFVPLPGTEGGKLPANVNWEQARYLAHRANEMYPGPDGLEWRLPTEAEYERAMRGRNLNENDQVDVRKVNVYASKKGKPLAVDAAGYENDLGLVHIRGNVWEWCEDGYADLSPTTIVNPRVVGRTKKGLYVLRGSSYSSNGRSTFLACRHHGIFPIVSGYDIGFRLVLAFEDA